MKTMYENIKVAYTKNEFFLNKINDFLCFDIFK